MRLRLKLKWGQIMARNGKIVLGETYRDKVSGWTGIAVAKLIYLNGCVRFQLGGKDKDGMPKDYIFDQEQLEPAKGPSIPQEKEPHGGDRSSEPPSR